MGSKIGSLLAPRRPISTETSSDGEWSAEAAAALIVGIVGLVVTGVAFAIRLRSGGRAELRRPTKAQSAEMAEPLGRILWRRVDLAKWGPDLADGIHLAAAAGAYASDGPLIEGAYIDPGVPGDLQEGEQQQ